MPEMRRSADTDNQIREPITEEELRQCEVITPEQVLRLNKITTGKEQFPSRSVDRSISLFSQTTYANRKTTSTR